MIAGSAAVLMGGALFLDFTQRRKVVSIGNHSSSTA